MKIVVIGGSGLIGSRLVSILRSRGHEVLAASPDSASIRSRVKDCPKHWPALRSSSTSRTRRHSTTRPF
jgi:nucleoside-diphosphate-sugar epimerase